MNSSTLSRSITTVSIAIFVLIASAVISISIGGNYAVIGMAVSAVLLAYALFELYQTNRTAMKVSKICYDVGFGDFESRVLNINDQGKFGEMQHNVNHMIDRIDAFVREAQASTVAIAENRYHRRILPHGLCGFLRTNADIINTASTIIQKRVQAFESETSSFKDTIDEIIGELSDTSKTMISASAELEAGSTDTTSRTGAVSSSAAETNRNLQTISSAITELAASAKELSNHLSESAVMTKESVEKAQQSRSVIANLSDSTARISQVIALIEDIADQTNLLALNATIEAARAGEAGKGFAVVAHEVKQLAQQSANATKEITDQINDIKGAMEKTVESIVSVSDTIEELNTMTVSAATTVEQQSHATNEIAESLVQVTSGTELVTENIQNVSQVAQSTEGMAVSVGHAATDLSTKAALLTDAVQSFMISLRKGPLDRRRVLKSNYEGDDRRDQKLSA